MDPQPIAQEDLASSMARLKQLMEEMMASTPTPPVPTESRNANKGWAGVNQEHGRVAVRVGDVVQVHQETEGLPYPVSDNAARR